MSQSDLDVNRLVRSVFVKHWIDLGRISVRCSDGKLWVRGALVKIAGVHEDLTPQIVGAMFDEIKRNRQVRQLYCNLENWNNDTGSWQEVGKTKKAERQITPPQAGVFDIGSDQGRENITQ